MQLSTALETMFEDGFALWVGAGVTHWISGAEGQSPVPLWGKLAELLENEADLAPPQEEFSFPQRMERVRRKLGLVRFQSGLRKATLVRAANSFLSASWSLAHNGVPPIPARARQLASLGRMANPIVSFNIETLTSLALACSKGPLSIKTFNDPQVSELDAFWRPRIVYPENGSSRFARHVYHPHGAIEMSGICVMTKTEYKRQQASLAFRLATHSAFMSNLAIVGMSLEDEYLRDQLSQFRRQIRQVFWFVQQGAKRNKIHEWASRARIELVEVDSWEDFWDAASFLSPRTDEHEEPSLLDSWKFTCSQAEGHLWGNTRQIKDFIEKQVPTERLPPEISADHINRAKEMGESLTGQPEFELTQAQLCELKAAFERAGAVKHQSKRRDIE